MSPRPRRAAAQAAAATLASNADGDAADDEGDAWGGKGRRSARGGDDSGDDKENLENMEEDESDDDDAAPTRRSGRARRANNRKVADSDDDDAQEDDEENVENENFVRRSSRAAKPVARLSPDWKQHASDGDDEPEAEETDPEGEYVEEEEDEETSEEDEESDEEIEGIPTRYSKRQRATVERYSPKPNERGLAGGGGDRRGRHSDSPPARGRRKKAKGGGKRRSSGPNYRESSDDDRGPRGGGKRWMDDTDDSDADAGAAGNPGNFPALFGGMFGGGRAPDMYPLAPPGQPGGGGGAVEAGGPGPGGKKEAADAEITPLTVDPTLTFEQVGGLSHYVHSLKEMVFLPLLYPEVFARFKMNPPRGVLLYGAPGTGKTLIARALAASCSRAGAEVSFYMRKGADVLSKWVGESERQLRLLFEEAQKRQPAIIFFDEIDGLAPVRSSKSDQIHNSIVATLLALMDGLDSRGRVVVLGATNRVDAIDGALRRPGRFDRELAFPLPNASARFEILKIHTRGWEKPPPALLLEQLATRCVGYCGADLKALCTEAAVHALRRRYPQIYESDDKLLIDPGQILPGRVDFRAAMEAITPASHRSAQAHARPLGPLRTPLMGPALATAIEATFLAFPPAAMAANADVRNASGDASGDASDRAPPTAAKVFDLDDLDDEDEDDGLELLEELDGQVANEEGNEGGVAKGGSKGSAGDGSSALSGASAAAALAAAALEFLNCPLARQPRLLLHGPAGSGQSPLAAALLHELEAFPVHAVGLPSLLADGGRSPEEALVGAVTEARRAAPAVLFLPSLRLWWDSATPTLRATLRTLMDDVPADTPLLLLATCDCECDELEPEASGLFGEGQTVRIDEPNDAALRGYFEPVVAAAVKAARAMDARDRDVANGVESKKRRGRALETLPKAPAPSLDQGAECAEVSTEGPGDAATAAMIAEEDHALRQQRMFLRDWSPGCYIASSGAISPPRWTTSSFRGTPRRSRSPWTCPRSCGRWTAERTPRWTPSSRMSTSSSTRRRRTGVRSSRIARWTLPERTPDWTRTVSTSSRDARWCHARTRWKTPSRNSRASWTRASCSDAPRSRGTDPRGAAAAIGAAPTYPSCPGRDRAGNVEAAAAPTTTSPRTSSGRSVSASTTSPGTSRTPRRSPGSSGLNAPRRRRLRNPPRSERRRSVKPPPPPPRSRRLRRLPRTPRRAERAASSAR